MYDQARGCPYGCKCDFDGLCFMYANVDVMHFFLVFWMIYYGVMMYDEGVT